MEEEIGIIKTLLKKTIKNFPYSTLESNTFYLN